MSTRIDWHYRRNGCRTCQRADHFLADEGMAAVEQIDARTHRIGPAEAIALARAADQLWVSRGQRFHYFDMRKDQPSDQELKRLLIGPSGNLRAPTVRRGKKLLVGFHTDAYREALCS